MVDKQAPSKGALGSNMENINDRNFEKFKGHLVDSVDGVLNASRWLNKLGYTVIMPPLSIAKDYNDRLNHLDGGDLFIQQRIEVKTLSAEFTCAEDWPFKQKFIVCAKHSFDNAKPKPYAYLIQNASKTHVAIVPASTHKEWQIEERRDSRYEDLTQLFYLCPLHLVKFFKM